MLRRVFVSNRSLLSKQCSQTRSATINLKSTEDCRNNSLEWVNAKPTSDIPGPTKFQLIRAFLPGGIFYKKSLENIILHTRQTYGDIVLMPGVFGQQDMVLTFNPDDFAKVIRSEGIWPKRRGMETMAYHRSVYRQKEFGGVVGLLLSNDENWAKLRTAVNPILQQPRNVRLYLNKLLQVNDEFLDRIREIRDPNTLEMPEDFENEISRLTFESVTIVALNQEIGLIRKNRDNQDVRKLFVSVREIFELSLHLDVYPSIWKTIKTPKFYRLMKAYDTMYDIIMKYINQALDKIENDKSAKSDTDGDSVLEKLLKIDKKVAVVMALDMVIGGVDTTTSTLVGILLCIAKNPEKQEKLRHEIRSVLPRKDSELTVDNMKDLPYLRACIKEAMRIYSITTGSIRRNSENIVMSGYQVPKNKDIILNSSLLFMDDKYYPQAKDFIPERWLRSEKNCQPQTNPFMHTPFGFGPRSCVGMRFVQLELEITLARLVRNFNIDFNYPTENAFKNRLINLPAIPLKFKFSDVEG